jgi:hypothetical protein
MLPPSRYRGLPRADVHLVPGKNGVTFGVRLAVYRNRKQSVPDAEATPQRHGDAAFADYLSMFGYTRSFTRQ